MTRAPEYGNAPARGNMEQGTVAMNAEKQHAEQLLDFLSPDQVAAVVHVMEQMLDPHKRKLATIPFEDEEISEEEECGVAVAVEWLKHNKPIPHEEVLAEYGLTMEDFERMGQTPLIAEIESTCD